MKMNYPLFEFLRIVTNMNIEDISKEELKDKLIKKTSKRDSTKKPVSIAKGIHTQIRGTVDEDTLLIEPTDDELEEAFYGVIDRVRRLLKPGGEYKIFCFMHLTSKQGPMVQMPGIVIYIDMTFEEFMSIYRENLIGLENKYIGGEEYNEQQLIISRVVNISFHYQVYDLIKKSMNDRKEIF